MATEAPFAEAAVVPETEECDALLRASELLKSCSDEVEPSEDTADVKVECGSPIYEPEVVEEDKWLPNGGVPPAEERQQPAKKNKKKPDQLPTAVPPAPAPAPSASASVPVADPEAAEGASATGEEPEKKKKKKKHTATDHDDAEALEKQKRKDERRKEKEREQKEKEREQKEKEKEGQGQGQGQGPNMPDIETMDRSDFLTELEHRFPVSEEVMASAEELASIPRDEQGHYNFRGVDGLSPCRACLLARQGPAKCQHLADIGRHDHGLRKNNADLRTAVRTFLATRKRDTPAPSEDGSNAPPPKRQRAATTPSSAPASASASPHTNGTGSWKWPVASNQTEALEHLETFLVAAPAWLRSTLDTIGDQRVRMFTQRALEGALGRL